MAANSPYFDPITDADMEAMQAQGPGFPGHAFLEGAIRELERIQRERAASAAWNAHPDASLRRERLTDALGLMKLALAITYFETNGTPTSNPTECVSCGTANWANRLKK